MGKAAPWKLVGAIGVLTMAGSVANNLSLEPPAWTWIELPLYLPVIWGTIRLAVRMRGGAASRAVQADAGTAA